MTRPIQFASRLIWAALAVFWLTFAAAAQTTDQSDLYKEWSTTASNAEQTLASDDASTRSLEDLRNELTTFRDRFLTAGSVNDARIDAATVQMNALGPEPEGTEEPPEIAARRAEIRETLKQLRAPKLTAEEAYTRADLLIKQIDNRIRERQAERLLTLSPTPLNPQAWPGALQDLRWAITSPILEFKSALADPDRIQTARANLPLSIFLMLVGVIFITYGRRFSEYFINQLCRGSGFNTGVWSFLLSLLRIALPVLGLVAITRSIFFTGLVEGHMERLLNMLPVWGLILLGFRWICERLFSKHDDEALLPMTPEHRSEARWYGTVLAILLVARGAAELLIEIAQSSPQTQGVISFPLVLAAGVILVRLGLILRHHVMAEDAESAESLSNMLRLTHLIGLAIMVMGVVAPVMAAVGYRFAGDALLYPTVLSLALVGLLIILRRFIGDVHGLFTGRAERARDELLPVLFSIALYAMSVPVFALIWGARVADLTEIWAKFREGFVIGSARISPSEFIKFVVIFAIGYALTRLIQGTMRGTILPKTRIDTGGRNAIVSGLGYVGIFLAALAAITGAGLDLSSLAIVAGALSVGIGFGLQTIVSNFVSGIILLIERPIAEGDWIEVNGHQGYVRGISVRSTRIETFDRSDIIVPNADLISGAVTNFTRGNTIGRVVVPVTVARGSDTRLVEEILLDIVESHQMVLANPAPFILLNSLDANGYTFQVRGILRDVNWLVNVNSDINHEIVRRFAEEGIEIALTQQDVWLHRGPRPDVKGPMPAAKPSEE